MERRPQSDVIAAIATPPGRGGVGIVRISGPNLGPFCLALTQRERVPVARAATLTRFVGRDGEVLDQGLILYFPAPGSYTGEDVVELHGHGGPIVMQMLLERCLELGARLARPGEFTERAFLNDRLDLAQAEGVIDLIDAGSRAAARSALKSLSGAFSTEVNQWRDQLIDLRMLVEATLDFPEEEIDFLVSARAFERLAALQRAIAALLRRARQGSLLRHGMHVVLVGQPNVGKSSLLNRLAGDERAIVTEVAGTTRDVLREHIDIDGVPLHILDTAGLRDTEDVVERIGIERTWRAIEQADAVVRLVDVRHGVTSADHEIDARLPSDVPVLWLYNKIDLLGQTPRREVLSHGVSLYISAATGAGLDLLREELLKIIGWEGHDQDAILARERHLEALRSAQEHVCCASELGDQLELMAEELRLAQEAINRITGEFAADDLLGVIFSRFCIGK